MRPWVPRNTRSTLLVVLGIVLLVPVLGCDTALDVEDAILARSKVALKSPSAAAGDVDLLKKLRPYIRCINGTSKAVLRAKQQYGSWMKDRNTGPTCKERRIRPPRRLLSLDSCTTRLIKANSLKPSLPTLEKSAKAYGEAITALKPLLEEAYRYYKTRTYRRDNCAKGKSLHPKLMAAFELANGHDLTMRGRVNFHNSELQKRRMASVARRYGKTHPRYFRRLIMADAKSLLKIMRIQLPKKRPDLKAISAALKRYKATLNRVDRSPRSRVGINAGYIIFKSQAKRFAEAAVEFHERKISRKGWSRIEAQWLRSDRGWLVKGSYARALRRYNKLVDRFNAVRFRNP